MRPSRNRRAATVQVRGRRPLTCRSARPAATREGERGEGDDVGDPHTRPVPLLGLARLPDSGAATPVGPLTETVGMSYAMSFSGCSRLRSEVGGGEAPLGGRCEAGLGEDGALGDSQKDPRGEHEGRLSRIGRIVIAWSAERTEARPGDSEAPLRWLRRAPGGRNELGASSAQGPRAFARVARRRGDHAALDGEPIDPRPPAGGPRRPAGRRGGGGGLCFFTTHSSGSACRGCGRASSA